MQRKADAAFIDQAKSITRKWREVKIWGKSVTGRLAHEDRQHPFSAPDEEVGVNMTDFRRMRKRDPFHVFSRIYLLTPEEALMNTILDVTDESMSSRQEGRTHSVPKPKRNLKPANLKSCPMISCQWISCLLSSVTGSFVSHHGYKASTRAW